MMVRSINVTSRCPGAMANLATRAGVTGPDRFRIHAPLITLSKVDIIRPGGMRVTTPCSNK